MSNTLIIQSHGQPLPIEWLQTQIESVINWAELNAYDYQFIGDELFEYLSVEILEKNKITKSNCDRFSTS